MLYYSPRSDELYHYGILGMKWGVRRYENKDGTLTLDGKKRYKHKKLTEKQKKTIRNVAIGIGTTAAIAGLGYLGYKHLQPTYIKESVAEQKSIKKLNKIVSNNDFDPVASLKKAVSEYGKNDKEAIRTKIANGAYVQRGSGEVLDQMINAGNKLNLDFMDNKLIGTTVSSRKTRFTDDDYSRAVFELKNNFCQERVNDVKKIGRILYGK